MKPIRILTPALEPLGEIDSYLSLSFCRRYHSYGEFELVLNRKARGASNIEINTLIILGQDVNKAGIIRHKEIKTNERGEEILRCKGCTLEGILQQRITIPPDGQAYDIREASAESVMKNYVQRNCVDIPEMAFPNLIIAPSLNRGQSVKWQSRYKNLAEELEQISQFSGVGWQIYLDFNLKKLVFDTYEGRDCSVNQQNNPPVIFSPEFENVKSQEYADSIVGYANYAVVAGKGEGAGREIVMLGAPDTGIDRYVTFVDARDVENTADLTERGNVRLSELKRLYSFQAEILVKGPFEYQKDWEVGDVVTVQNKEWGVVMDCRVTEVTEIYEAGGFQLKAVFGNSLPTLSRKLKSAFKDVKTVVTS